MHTRLSRGLKCLSLARKLSAEIGFESLRRNFTIRVMYRAHEFQTVGLLALGLAVISAIARGFWLYRASLTMADGG